jgi:hypothetical protein
MVASVFCIKGYYKDDQAYREGFHVEPLWWPRDEVFADPRMKEITDGMFLDYEAHLSVPEARELHERYRPLAGEGRFVEQGWKALAEARLEVLDRALIQEPDKYSHILVAFYEWSSGM